MEKHDIIDSILKSKYSFSIPDINLSSAAFGGELMEIEETFCYSYLYDKYVCSNYLKYNAELIKSLDKKYYNDKLYIMGYLSGIFLSTEISNHFPLYDHEKYSFRDITVMNNFELHTYLDEIKSIFKNSRYNEDNEDKYYTRYFIENYNYVTYSTGFHNVFQLGVLRGSFYNINELMEKEQLQNGNIEYYAELEHVNTEYDSDVKEKYLQM